MQKMLKTMRWFGPHDAVRLRDIRQAGVSHIVTALHQIPVGEVWPEEAIRERQEILRKEGLEWAVVESLPVHEDIKRGRGERALYIENYKTSIRNLAACGIQVITYNFMPVLDWIRTDHAWENADGTRTLAYRHVAFIYFDLELLKRPGAEADYTPEQIAEARTYGNSLSDSEREGLFRRVLLGLPGSKENFTAEQLLELLAGYADIDSETMRRNLIHFLTEVTPIAAEVKAKLAIHPDDPPFSLLGLPRIMSTEEDARLVFEAVPGTANGLCYCTGSFGAHPQNDLLRIIDTYGDRIHFLHLRNVARSGEKDFRESAHLEGDNPMRAIMQKLLQLMEQRNVVLPMRPDHGFLHDLEANTDHYPGYSLIGRLKALAELSGLEKGLIDSER
ncbi:mannonate dehydratase [Roseivirga sp. BDSF3-8]|uniref:mannonate dehydratase n=1 Tax=Roseivirga sp. BDSF3-8 TaxID=3241598 RepID=UPI0035324D4F